MEWMKVNSASVRQIKLEGIRDMIVIFDLYLLGAGRESPNLLWNPIIPNTTIAAGSTMGSNMQYVWRIMVCLESKSEESGRSSFPNQSEQAATDHHDWMIGQTALDEQQLRLNRRALVEYTGVEIGVNQALPGVNPAQRRERARRYDVSLEQFLSRRRYRWAEGVFSATRADVRG
ncbi:hypothetical protein OE88DRAFT_1661355 [Heliocybe sulcata]|uniref:Uncharacterized protein n=1 Tax=Heliocybe sulcata TaxID=5364 RepID=A0A5C3N0E6_9AGAM|nr:hypothetical protein OE88DRAFT_1661355 [Heliocybe sulcata]